MWAGTVNDFLIDPYILPKRLIGESYHNSLKQMLPELLQDVPIAIRNLIWFQHDGTPAKFSADMSAYMKDMFGATWIGRGGLVFRPRRYSQLSPLHYFLWEHLRSLL